MASVAQDGPPAEALHRAPDRGARRLPRLPRLRAARLLARGRPAAARRGPGRPRRLARPALGLLPALRARLDLDSAGTAHPGLLPDRAPVRDGLDAGQVRPRRRVDTRREGRGAAPL